jgi:hypothetical protein
MTGQQQIDPLVWTFEETCAALKVSATTGERRLRQGDWPPTIRIGHLRFSRPDDVKAWLDKRVEQARSAA